MEVDFDKDDILQTSESVLEMEAMGDASINTEDDVDQENNSLKQPDSKLVEQALDQRISWDPMNKKNSVINNGRFTESEATEDMDPYAVFSRNEMD